MQEKFLTRTTNHDVDGLRIADHKTAQCATYYHHMIFATTMNISSDLLLISIPIPLIIRIKLPLRRKLILICVLCLGVFNVSIY